MRTGGAGVSEHITSRRVSLVANTSSRTGQRAFPEALEILRRHGVTPRSAHPLSDPSRLVETVHAVLDEGCDLLILGGGDGTISSVVDELAGHSAALALLPLGTANDFARTMEIPTSLHAACDTIANGKVVDIDLGLSGDNYYVNTASVGLSVGVTHALSPRLKKLAGPLAYPIATAKAFARHKHFSARLTFPEGDHEPVEVNQLIQLAVGNGRFYGGGNIVAPGSGIDDRMLDVYTIEHSRGSDLANVAYRFKNGSFVHSKAARHYRTPQVKVETDRELTINLDGELEQRTPQSFSVAQNALRVLVPVDSTAATDDRGAAAG